MKIIQSLILGLALFCLGSCSDNKTAENTITVAVSADNPPYEFIQDGKIVGLDIDIINAIGEVLGKEVVIKNLDFPGLLPALSSNNVDMVISAISATEERKKSFDFSDVYATSTMSVLYRKEEAIQSVVDLSNKVIGAQLGTTWENEAKDLVEKMPGTLVRSLANNLALVEELKSGSVDAVILEDMQVAKFIANNPTLASFTIPGSSSNFAIAFPKNSVLKDEVNKAIADLQNKGKLAAFKKNWMQ